MKTGTGCHHIKYTIIFLINATVSLESGVPVLFGVLTTENIEQAIERAGTKAGNKGYDCAVSAIEMVNLLREMDTAAE